MGEIDHEKCKRAIMEIRKTISGRIAELDEQFVNALESEGACDSTRLFADAMTDLMFDVIEHAISYTDNATGLEAAKERLQGSIDLLEVAIAIWNESQPTGDEWRREFDAILNPEQARKPRSLTR